MNVSLSTLVERSLPAISNSHVTYNAQRNMYLTDGYTSAMGHTYFQGIQLSDRVAVVYNIGRGGWGCNPLFLNGVTVYCFDGTAKKIIGSWSPAGWEFYSEYRAQSVAGQLLLNYLKSQMKMIGSQVSDSELSSFATAQIQAAATKTLGM